MKKNLLICHHLGMGDHFDLCGAVNYLSMSYEVVYLFVKEIYYSIIKDLYKSNPKIKLFPVLSNEKFEQNNLWQLVTNFMARNSQSTDFLKIGFDNYPLQVSPTKNCWEYFYEELNLPKEIRYNFFNYDTISRESDLVYDLVTQNKGSYAFVHDDPSRGFVINRNLINPELNIICNDYTINPLHYSKVLKNAAEIHCMESSIKTLIELFPTNGNLYFHDLRKHPLGLSKKNWNVIQYPWN